MKKGTCPKCGSQTIHMLENGIGGLYGQDLFDGKSSQKGKVTTHACVTCGYFENYIAELKNLELIAKKWAKVPPQ